MVEQGVVRVALLAMAWIVSPLAAWSAYDRGRSVWLSLFVGLFVLRLVGRDAWLALTGPRSIRVALYHLLYPVLASAILYGAYEAWGMWWLAVVLGFIGGAAADAVLAPALFPGVYREEHREAQSAFLTPGERPPALTWEKRRVSRVTPAASRLEQLAAMHRAAAVTPARLPGMEVLEVDGEVERAVVVPGRLPGDIGLLTDLVDCSVFAPPSCRPGETLFVQVFAHVPDEETLAASLAAEFDEESARRAVKSLLSPIAQGSVLVFDLSFPSLRAPDPVQSLVWWGRPASVQFEVPVPKDASLGPVVGTVGVSQDGVPIGHVKFKLLIAASREGEQPVGDDARRYRQAFISYASSDRSEVLRRTQMLAAVGIRFFQDVLDLEPGDRWQRELYRNIDECDLLLLFWSTAARDSEWVRREVGYALDRKAGDDFAPPEIKPVIIEGPPVPEPWQELSHLHFNDRLVWALRD